MRGMLFAVHGIYQAKRARVPLHPAEPFSFSCCSDGIARYKRCLSQPDALSISTRAVTARYFGMQTLTLSSNASNGRLLESNHSLRLRAFRFLSERYTQRERPSVAAEFILFAVIVLTAAWPMVTLAHAMALTR